MFDLSPIQVVIVLIIALLAFGPRRLPELGRSIGRGMREVRSAMNPFDMGAESGRAAPSSQPAPPAPPQAGEAEPAATPEDLAGLIVPGDSPPEPQPPDDQEPPAEAPG